MLFDAGFDVVREEAWHDRYFMACNISQDDKRLYKLRLAYALVE